MSDPVFKLAVLLSGSGTTMLNLHEKIISKELPAQIAVVVSSKKKVAGVSRAQNLGIPTYVHKRSVFFKEGIFDEDSYSAELGKIIEPYKPDLVVMAGFMTRISKVFLDKYQTINIHPALLPSFGGEGFWGHHVHEAVLDAGVKLSGATVHFANSQYDKGPIIMQKAVPVKEDDTPDTLAKRVQEAEREIYPKAISLISRGLVKIQGNRTIISSSQEKG